MSKPNTDSIPVDAIVPKESPVVPKAKSEGHRRELHQQMLRDHQEAKALRNERHRARRFAKVMIPILL